MSLTSVRPLSILTIMFFSRLLKKNNPSEPELEISAPISQPFQYGQDGCPPWMNDYATHLTAPICTPHAASKKYHTKHAYTEEAAISRSSTEGWGSDSSRSVSLNDISAPSPLLQVPYYAREGYIEPTKHKKRHLFRNRGLNANGELADDYEEIAEDAWDSPYSSQKKHRKW